MNRRDFLMRLGAGLVGALVVRPSFTEPNLISKKNLFELYGGGAGGGKTIAIMHPNQMEAYYKILGQCEINNPRQVGIINNISEQSWDKLTRSQEAFFRS